MAQQILTLKRTLTSSEITSLGGTPVTLIVAPGAGKFIKLIAPVIMKLNWGTIAYNTGRTIRLLLVGGSQTICSMGSTFASQTADTTKQMTEADSNNAQLDENDAVEIGMTGGNFTQGDGTITIWIHYTIEAI